MSKKIVKDYRLFLLTEGQWVPHTETISVESTETSPKGRKVAAKIVRGLKLRKTGCWKLRAA